MTEETFERAVESGLWLEKPTNRKEQQKLLWALAFDVLHGYQGVSALVCSLLRAPIDLRIVVLNFWVHENP